MQASYTVAVTSDIANRLEQAVRSGQQGLNQESVSRLQEVREKIDELQRRGFLKRQKYCTSTPADFHSLMRF